MFALGTAGWQTLEFLFGRGTLEFLFGTFPKILSFAVLVLMAAIALGFGTAGRSATGPTKNSKNVRLSLVGKRRQALMDVMSNLGAIPAISRAADRLARL
jgi:hypothetical protein